MIVFLKIMNKTQNNSNNVFPGELCGNIQEERNLFDARFSLEKKNVFKEQDMAKSLDTDLRKFFGFGKKQFKNIVKKPGVRFGFKLSNYISPNDSVSQIENVLRQIAEHVSFTQASPVKAIFHKIFKEELRVQYFERHPKKYLIKCRIGVTLSYSNKQKQEMVRTIRGIEKDFIEKMSPKSMTPYTATLPTQIMEYRGVSKDQYDESTGGIGPFNVHEMKDTEFEGKVKKSVGHYKTLEIWLEELPVIVEHTEFTKSQFIELQDELLERASVLSDNFLKHAGGIHIKAQEETDGKCVENQLLEFFLNPSYTDAIKRIPENYGSDTLCDLNQNSLRTYLDSIPKKEKEQGFSTRQLSLMCVDIKLNMYALDHDSKCFLKVTQFDGDIWPKGQSGHTRHHPLIFYVFNKHFYLITHHESIKSIAESCKDTTDSRGFQITDEVISESLPIFAADDKSVNELLEFKEGQYIFEKDSLESEVFEYIQTTNLAPMIQLKNNKIVGFTVSQVRQPKPLPPVPTKPKRGDFLPKGKKSQPAYDAAINKYEKLRADHEKAKAALKSSSADKKHITHRFSCNPNFVEGFPHEAVKVVCEANKIPFHNQGAGSLGLELSKRNKNEIPVPADSKEKLFQEQEGKCANPDCQTEIRLCNNTCHCDHIIPREDGGTNDLENLQLLCVACHKDKCASEKESGYGENCPDYHSQFSPSVYKYVLPYIHPLPFVELTDAAIKPLTEKKNYHNEQKEKAATIFKVQDDTSGQEILDNITKGTITIEQAINALETIDEIYHSRESKNRLEFVKNQSHTFKVSTLDGSTTNQVQPEVKRIRKLGADKGERMKQTQLKETFFTEETLKKMADWQFDFKSQYPNIAKYRKNNWPKTSVMDAPRPFSGKIEPQKAGWYYVETTCTFPFRGSTYYPVQTVILGLEHKLIRRDDIKFELIPSDVLAPDHFVSYFDRIEQAFEGLEGTFTTSNTKSSRQWDFKSVLKTVKCSLIGAFAQKERQSEWCRATLSKYTAANWTINDGTDRECFVSQPLLETDFKFNEIFVGRFKETKAIESSALLIRAEILEESSRMMFLLERDIKNIGGLPLWRKTDAVGGRGPQLDISKYYYDEERKVPMLQFEDPAPPKDERKPREIREPIPSSVFHYFLQYKFFENQSYDGNAPQMAQKIIDTKKGCTLTGRPGTGKTTLANAVIDLLETQNVKYMALSTTHVSKKKMGSINSELRKGQHANTIDSLYRRWRHKQEFVISALKLIEYIIIDEISMMREQFYAMLCHIKRAIPGIKMILIGDIETQFLPVKDTWNGDYAISAALYDLCDGNKVKLTKCRREEGEIKELFDLCTDIINEKEIDISLFAPTEPTRENIGYLHKTRKRINEEWMEKEAKDLPEDQVIRLDANEADEKSQNVILCANTPVICIRKSKSIKIDNGERFTIQNFSDEPDYSIMKREELRKCCDEKKLKVGGNKAELMERLQNAASDLVLKLDDDATSAVEVRVPRHLFQKHFRVAYAITYFQSQGCTLTGKYTIWDWDFYHVNWRARNVAVSRATSKANIQIAPLATR